MQSSMFTQLGARKEASLFMRKSEYQIKAGCPSRTAVNRCTSVQKDPYMAKRGTGYEYQGKQPGCPTWSSRRFPSMLELLTVQSA